MGALLRSAVILREGRVAWREVWRCSVAVLFYAVWFYSASVRDSRLTSGSVSVKLVNVVSGSLLCWLRQVKWLPVLATSGPIWCYMDRFGIGMVMPGWVRCDRVTWCYVKAESCK